MPKKPAIGTRLVKKIESTVTLAFCPHRRHIFLLRAPELPRPARPHGLLLRARHRPILGTLASKLSSLETINRRKEL